MANGTLVSRSVFIVPEIARNIERVESGKAQDRVCLCHTGIGGRSCVCYRDAGHNGPHHCPCGAEWRG